MYRQGGQVSSLMLKKFRENQFLGSLCKVETTERRLLCQCIIKDCEDCIRQFNLKFQEEKSGMTSNSLMLAYGRASRSILKSFFGLMRWPVSQIVIYQGCATFISERPNTIK